MTLTKMDYLDLGRDLVWRFGGAAVTTAVILWAMATMDNLGNVEVGVLSLLALAELAFQRNGVMRFMRSTVLVGILGLLAPAMVYLAMTGHPAQAGFTLGILMLMGFQAAALVAIGATPFLEIARWKNGPPGKLFGDHLEAEKFHAQVLLWACLAGTVLLGLGLLRQALI